jgi:hypothetical protein
MGGGGDFSENSATPVQNCHSYKMHYGDHLGEIFSAYLANVIVQYIKSKMKSVKTTYWLKEAEKGGDCGEDDTKLGEFFPTLRIPLPMGR